MYDFENINVSHFWKLLTIVFQRKFIFLENPLHDVINQDAYLQRDKEYGNFHKKGNSYKVENCRENFAHCAFSSLRAENKNILNRQIKV